MIRTVADLKRALDAFPDDQEITRTEVAEGFYLWRLCKLIHIVVKKKPNMRVIEGYE